MDDVQGGRLVQMDDVMKAVKRPSLGTAEQEAARMMQRVFRALHGPVFVGREHLPAPGEGPTLFVGNHTLYGVVDAPVMFLELWFQEGIFLRALGDHTHFKIPGWRDVLTRYGVVDGTREHCAALMQAGEHILVFPGGGREVSKRKGERYELIWKERLGFARMAVEQGCTLQPFSAVGAEEALDILVDADEIMASPLGPWLRIAGVRPDVVLPIVKGIGPTPIPRPERLYFEFHEPISTEGLAGQHEDVEVLRALRDEVRASVEAGIERLRERQKRDPKRSWRQRLLGG